MTEGTYMAGAWLREGPCYVVRAFGVGENVLRAGDLVADVLSGRIVHPEGAMYLAKEKVDAMTKTERKALKKLGVKDILPIREVTP